MTTHNRVNGPVRVNPFTLVKLPRETVERFLALFATTPLELASELAACELPWQMLPLQTRPLVRIGDDVVVLDEPFPLEAVTTGLYWRVSDHVRMSDPDAGFPPGRLHYWKATFLADLPGEAIDTILRFCATAPSAYTEIGLQQITGAASRVARTATAFAHRGRHYDFLILSQWDDPSDSPDNMRWTRELFDTMSPYFRGVYVNNVGEEGSDRVRDAYGINYDRLAGIKAAYDPDNVFRLNQNIPPAGGAPA